MLPIDTTSFKIVVLILLSACTIIFFNHYERYQIVGTEILKNAAFHNGLNNWQHNNATLILPPKNEPLIKLEATSPIETPSLSQAILLSNPPQLLSLSCEIKTQNIIGGDKDWKAARITLVSSNKDGVAIYDIPHLLALQRGSSLWNHYEKVFTLLPEASKVTVAAQIFESTGTLLIRSISLHPVLLKQNFKDYRQYLLVVWVVILFWVAAPLINASFKSVKHIMVLVLATGIIIGVLMPENLKDTLGATLLSSTTAVSWFIPTEFNDTQSFGLNPKLPELDIYKAGHFVMFALLSIALLGARPYSKPITRLILFLVLFALVTEVLQLFMAGRTAQFADILIDSGGIATGFVIAWMWRQIYRHHQWAKPR